eukprot:scaffold54686_cov41-Prasinocladus_malaysianus.AAC.1
MQASVVFVHTQDIAAFAVHISPTDFPPCNRNHNTAASENRKGVKPVPEPDLLPVDWLFDSAVAKQTVDAYGRLCSPIEEIIHNSMAQHVTGRRRVMVPLEVLSTGSKVDVADGAVDIRLVRCAGLPYASELARFQVTATNTDLEIGRRSRVRGPIQTAAHLSMLLKCGKNCDSFALITAILLTNYCFMKRKTCN